MQQSLVPLPDDLPTFETALQRLGDVPTILWHALEQAASETSAFKESKSPKRWLDSGLSASLFRHFAIDYLRGEGMDAQLDGKWRFNHLPFLGISFHFNRYHIRILKGRNGLLPGCGFSRPRKRFYNQIPTPYLEESETVTCIANLIVLWDFTPAYTLKHLWLTLPAMAGRLPQDVAVYWCDPLPHPAEQQSSIPTPEAQGDDGLGGLVAPNEELDEIKADER
jgi:hypothetical protein